MSLLAQGIAGRDDLLVADPPRLAAAVAHHRLHRRGSIRDFDAEVADHAAAAVARPAERLADAVDQACLHRVQRQLRPMLTECLGQRLEGGAAAGVAEHRGRLRELEGELFAQAPEAGDRLGRLRGPEVEASHGRGRGGYRN